MPFIESLATFLYPKCQAGSLCRYRQLEISTHRCRFVPMIGTFAPKRCDPAATTLCLPLPLPSPGPPRGAVGGMVAAKIDTHCQA